MLQALQLIKELYHTGGIVVITRSEEVDASRSSICAWTLIQPDGDVITKVSSAVAANPAYWAKHLENVERQVTALRRFRKFLQWMSTSSAPIITGIGYTAFFHTDKMNQLLIMLIPGAVFSILLLFVRWAIGVYLKFSIGSVGKRLL